MHMSIGYLEPLVCVTFVHANLCTHILASIFQDGGNPFPGYYILDFLLLSLPVLNSVTDESQHTLHYYIANVHVRYIIIHRRITSLKVKLNGFFFCLCSLVSGHPMYNKN